MKQLSYFHTVARQLFAFCLFASFTGLTSAQPAGGNAPPAEALEACKTLASGAACKSNGPQGAYQGSCWAPEGKPLACKPAGGQPPAQK